MFVAGYIVAVLVCLIGLSSFCAVDARRLSEPERVRYWHERNNTWPPNWQPETETYKRNMELREAELMRLPGADERWENFMQYTASRMVPRFTPKGFEVIQTPPEAQALLKKAVDDALLDFDNIREEARVDVLYTPIASKFIDVPSVTRKVQEILLPLHEAWVGGMSLTPTSIYGIRMNRNGSSLVMHYDKIQTHVISSIVHIAHEYDDDDHPWPIEIEDHDGVLHAVNLEPGQMLFYESAACLHGRRQVLRGKYYASVFTHYQPTDPAVWNFNVEEVINNVPPHWSEGVIEAHGSRYAGQGLTIDSRVSDAAPPRIINGQRVDDIVAFYEDYRASQHSEL